MYRQDFPFFNKHPELIYFDNAATHQLPRSVILAIKKFYEESNANPLRGLYDLSVSATEQVKNARATIAKYINAENDSSIIFTRGATDSLNLASTSLTTSLSSDDEVVVFQDSHHSNILPWVELCARTGAYLRVISCEPGQEFDSNVLNQAFTPNTRVVAASAMSNVTGDTCYELSLISQKARQCGAYLIVDAAQAIAHTKLDVANIQADFLAFSGHKIGAPTGIGVLYCHPDLLTKIRPAYFGGEMVDTVHLGHPYNGLSMQLSKPPHRFEAGTLNTGGIVGLAAAIDYWQRKDPAKLFARVEELTSYLADKVKTLPGIRVCFLRHGIFTFNLSGIHPHDVAQALAANHIAVRAGYHCAQPLHEALDLGPTVRASLSFYNTEEEIDTFIAALKQVRTQLGYE